MSIFRKKPQPQNIGFREADSRLARLRDGAGFFTSNLSVNEFALCSSLGIRPLGQVSGSMVYQKRLPRTPYSSCELPRTTQASWDIRHLVFSQLQQEAALLKAEAVMGVQLKRKEVNQEPGIVQWTAYGTAIVWNPVRGVDMPFLTPLSAQELWALHQAGYRPIGLAFGVCDYYQRGDRRFEGSGGLRSLYSALPVQDQPYSTWVNREDRGLTMGVRKTRMLAMTRLESQAVEAKADGVVGICWEIDTDIRREEDISDSFRQDAYLSVSVIGAAVAKSHRKFWSANYSVPLSD